MTQEKQTRQTKLLDILGESKQTKNLGGLKFRDVQTFNHALLEKIVWRITTNPSCLLSDILIGKYRHNASLMTTPLPSSFSHGWKEILNGPNLLIKHLGKTIDNCNTTKFWNDSWIQPMSNLRIVDHLQRNINIC